MSILTGLIDLMIIDWTEYLKFLFDAKTILLTLGSQKIMLKTLAVLANKVSESFNLFKIPLTYSRFLQDSPRYYSLQVNIIYLFIYLFDKFNCKVYKINIPVSIHYITIQLDSLHHTDVCIAQIN